MSESSGSGAPRLVQIAEFDRPHAGSFVPVLDGLLRTAGARGWRTEVVLPEAAGRAEWVGALAEHSKVRLAPSGVLGTRTARSRWLAEQLRGDPGPTVLHTHFTAWDVAALSASLVPRVSADAVFWHIHSALPKAPQMIARGVVKFGVLGRGVDGIICPAPNIALGALQWLAPHDRVHFVPSALAADAHPLITPADREAARRELEIPADARVVLHFGWHNFLKATDTFLETMRVLVDRDPSILALIRGHEAVSESEAAALGLGDNVRFQPPVDDASTLFAAADVVVSSSREEGMAYTVLEAVTSGTPVVATPIPGHTFIADAVDACRITRRDPVALADATLEALDEPAEQREREARQAHDWVAENLSIEAIASRVVDLYEDAIDAPRGRREPARPTAAPAPARVFQVVQFANPNPGSFVPMLVAANRAVAAAGAIPEVVVGVGSAGHPWIEDLRSGGARVRFAPDVGRDGMRRWLREVIDESDSPVILHTHFTDYDLAAAAAAARSERAHVIWHVHSALNREPTVYVRNLVKFGLLSRLVDRIICPSPDLEVMLRERGAASQNVDFIPNGIDAHRFRPASAEARARARSELGLSPEVPTLVGFSWNWEIKGGELFVRSLAAARERAEGLVGLQINSQGHGPKLAAELGIAEALRTLEPQRDVRRLYAASDVLVAASEREGIPFAVLEALSSGLRVVASDIASHRFIAERSDAVTIVPREPAAFADAIVAALAEPPRTGSEMLPEEFSLDRWAARVAAVYAELGVIAPSSSAI